MFGRMVKIDGREILVLCTPKTPLSEVLYRASQQMRQLENEAADNSPIAREYRKALNLR